MELADRVIVVTGSGIGRALAERFAAERPRGIAVVDLNGDGARAVADRIGGLARTADLTYESEVRRVVAETEARCEALAPAAVADIAVDGPREERFLILTDPRTAELAALRATKPGVYLEATAGLWSAVGGRDA